MFTPSPTEELSPIAACLRLAAARGRELRLARERAWTLAADVTPSQMEVAEASEAADVTQQAQAALLIRDGLERADLLTADVTSQPAREVQL